MKPKNVENIYRLSPSQQGILFETLGRPDSGIHIEQLICRLKGNLNRSAFERAWQAMVDRHPVLRTGFVWKDLDEPLQVVRQRVTLPIEGEDWSRLAPAVQARQLETYLHHTRQRGFDPSLPPLARLALFQIAPQSWQLVWTHHHILMDGWCGPLLIQEFLTCYEAFRAGREPQLPATRPYSDYIKWLRRQDSAKAEAFWRTALDGFTGPTPLGADAGQSDAATEAERYGRQEERLPAATVSALRALARQRQLTLYTIIQGVWALLLSRYSGRDDVVFGATVSGRPPDLAGVESTVGLFINTLPVRVRVAPEPSLWTWLAAIHAHNLDLQQYEYTPGNLVHQWSGLPGAVPLYESLLVFENYPVAVPVFESSGLSVEMDEARFDGARTGFLLTLLVLAAGEPSMRLVHDGRRMDGASARRVLEHFTVLLNAIATDGDRPLGWFRERIPLDQIPKVRPRPTRERHPSAPGFVAPRTPTETAVAALWAEVLGVERVGIHDNFFDLGGHSLLAIQLYYALREAYPLELPLSILFEEPDVRRLAQVIDDAAQGRPAVGLAPMTPDDLAAQVALDPEIAPGGAVPEWREPRAMLLTGATGFLGAHLLHELLRRTSADVYCLVRSTTTEAARKRLEETLRSYGLWNEEVASRVVPITGDLSRPRLGLPVDDFERLAACIDAVYHSGALVSYVLPYSRLKGSNVDGTTEVLRFATHGRPKAVHYVSSLAVFPLAGPDEVPVISEDDALSSAAGLYGGYEQSKWVADRLVLLARTRGIPATIYRPGLITGRAETGAGETDNLMCAMIKGCLQLGAVPELDTDVDMTPVDYASRAIVEISRQRASQGKVFHLANPRPARWSEVVDRITAFGYRLERLPFDAWHARLVDRSPRPTESPLYPLLPLLAERAAQARVAGGWEFTRSRMPRYDCRHTVAALASTSVVCPPVDARLLDTYLSYFVRSGFLAAPPDRGARPAERSLSPSAGRQTVRQGPERNT
jgi:thioester reductase-like protein